MLIGNRYRLVDKLGQGGVGIVYKAFDRLTGDYVALKQVKISAAELAFTSRPSDSDTHAQNLALALEFRTLASLRHPNIVTVLDYGFDDQHQPFFTMQLLENAVPINEYGTQLSITDKARLLIEMLQALAYLHRRNIIHHDLKPTNVLVTARGDEPLVKVMDFGLAVNRTQTISASQKVLAGTVAYMAPELFEEREAMLQSDLFAVGIMAYEMFVGHHPFASKNTAVMLLGIINGTPDTSMFDFALAQVIQRLLAKKPEDRYESAQAVIEALCEATGLPQPPESASIRESYLQASAFVGRKPELEALKAALEDISKTPAVGSTWLIGGESGVGKSRLVEELRIRALTRGALVLRGQAVASGGLPYQLWRGPLRRLVLSSELSDTDASVLKELVPDIGELLERDIPAAAVLDATDNQRRLVSTITSIFQRLTLPTSVVLILEDLHWAAESLEMLKSLHSIARDLPLLIIGNYRDEATPNLPDSFPGAHVVKLTRFNDQTIEDLTASMIGEAGRQPELTSLIKRETDGNAFFMIEVVRMLAEEAGRLEDIGRHQLPEMAFGGSMQAIILRKLRRVPESDQQLLKLAAVVGREIDLKLIGHIVAGGQYSTLEAWLTVCANAGVLELHDDRWHFSHDKLRDALVTGLNDDDRKRLHRQAAEAIESVYPDNVTWTVVLLEHWRQAGDKAREIVYAQRAVEQLIAVSNLREAEEITWRTLRNVSDIKVKANLLRLLGEAKFRLGQIDQAWETLHESIMLARVANAREIVALSLKNLGSIAMRQGKHDIARNHFEQSLEIARELNDWRIISENLETIGDSNALQGNFSQARGYYEQSLEICREHNIKSGIAGCLSGLGWVASSESDYAGSLANYEQCLAIGREIGDRRTIAIALGNIGAISAALGNYATARDYYQQQLQIHRETGLKAGVAWSLWAMARMWMFQGDYKAAIEHNTQSMAINRELGDRAYYSANLRLIGQIAYFIGDTPTALSTAVESLSLSREVGQQIGVTQSLILLGYSHTAMGELDAAQERFDEGLEIARERSFNDLTADALSGQGWAALLRGDYETARARYEEALQIARKISYYDAIASNLLRIGLIAALQKDLIRAFVRYTEALDIAKKMGFKQHLASASIYLGFLYLDQTAPELAIQHWVEGLRIAHTLEAKPLMLQAVLGIAEHLHLHGGQCDDLLRVLRDNPLLIANPLRSRLDVLAEQVKVGHMDENPTLATVVLELLDQYSTVA